MSALVLALIVSLFVLLCLSGFFSSSETVFFSLNPLTLRRIGQVKPHAGATIHRILSKPTELLSTVLIGNTIVNVAIAAVGFSLAEHLVPGRGEQISIPAITVLLVIFGEAGPKRIGLLFADRLAVLYAPAILLLMKVATPLRILMETITHALQPFFRPRGRTLSEEEFETVLDISEEQGIINDEEFAMIMAIVNLEDMKASDIMTPRVDLVGIDLSEEDPAEYLEIARKSKRNFLPLYHDQIDKIDGFIDTRKFLLDPGHSIDNARFPAFFIPESSPVNQLLVQFQKEHRRIAVVVDEYGGTAGVVTRGDILEEITGDIYNELTKPRALFQSAGPHRWLVDANISLEELDRRLLLDLEAEGADRLSGWIAAHLGHVPEQDDTVEAQGCRVTVMQTLRQRVTLAQIEKLDARRKATETKGQAEEDKEE